MLKLWGALFVAFAFFIFGEKMAKKKRQRLDFLESMSVALEEFKCAIEIFSLAVPRALEKSGIEEIKEKADRENTINEEDNKDFEIFITGLGAQTLPGQLVNVSIYRQKLEKEEVYEREKYKKESKLIKGGFVLLGFLTVIMLL